MPNLIRPNSVKVITQDGEVQVSITLDLNINLNTEGIVTAQNIESKKEEKKIEEPKEETLWAIPDFDSMPKINFGK